MIFPKCIKIGVDASHFTFNLKHSSYPCLQRTSVCRYSHRAELSISRVYAAKYNNKQLQVTNTVADLRTQTPTT